MNARAEVVSEDVQRIIIRASGGSEQSTRTLTTPGLQSCYSFVTSTISINDNYRRPLSSSSSYRSLFSVRNGCERRLFLADYFTTVNPFTYTKVRSATEQMLRKKGRF